MLASSSTTMSASKDVGSTSATGRWSDHNTTDTGLVPLLDLNSIPRDHNRGHDYDHQGGGSFPDEIEEDASSNQSDSSDLPELDDPRRTA